MIRVNENYLKLKSSYLFSDIAKRVSTFQKENPGKEIIRLGIGDVTRALPSVCIEAFHKAVDELGMTRTLKDMARNKDMHFFVKKLPSMIISQEMQMSVLKKFLSVMVLNAIQEISRSSSLRIFRSQFQILSIQFMLIQM